MNRKSWLDSILILDKEINKGRNFIIWQHNGDGEEVKKILNNIFHKKELFIIDSVLSTENSEYKKPEYLKSLKHSNFIVILASKNYSVHQDILFSAKKYVRKSHILDFYKNRLVSNQENIPNQRITSVGKNEYKKTICCSPTQRMWYFLKSIINILFKLKEDIFIRIFHSHHKDHFIRTIKNKSETRILDVGCGNQAVREVKNICPNVFYTGIDVGDYNQTEQSKSMMDKYIIVKPEEFASKIAELGKGENNGFDIIISNHNIEHCNEPMKVLESMCHSLKKNGRMFIAFPSEISACFPSRKGTLNFYDDGSHQNLPVWNEIIQCLMENDMKIIFKSKSMRGWYLRHLGKRLESISESVDRIIIGTWDYWGFESMIWVKKI